MPITVFISYSWDSDEHKQAVVDLAAWLEKNSNGQVHVEIDFKYSITPPTEGWPVWMTGKLVSCDVILMVCTPSYAASFVKQEIAPTYGRGARLEGAIITQQLYNAYMVNKKFYPILPEDGRIDDVPLVVQSWFNGHYFPSGYAGILGMVLGENPTLNDVEQIDGSQETVESDFVVENDIVSEVINHIIPETKQMFDPVHLVVRGFLGLSPLEQVKVIRNLGISTPELAQMSLVERNKEIFRRVSADRLLGTLWAEINKLKPFENPDNPFQ